LRLIANGRNRGKGFSVRHGMLEARGEIALLRMPIYPHRLKKRIKLLAALRENGFDAAIGSRALDRRPDRSSPIRISRVGGQVF